MSDSQLVNWICRGLGGPIRMLQRFIADGGTLSEQNMADLNFLQIEIMNIVRSESGDSRVSNPHVPSWNERA